MDDKEIYDSMQDVTGKKQTEELLDDTPIAEGKPMLVDGVRIEVHGLSDVNVREARNYIQEVAMRLRQNVQSRLTSITIRKDEDDRVSLDYTSDLPKFERIRRITGYLVGTMNSWNNAKRAEEQERVKHASLGFKAFVHAARSAYDTAIEQEQSAADKDVQDIFLSLCDEHKLDPSAMAASLLAHAIGQEAPQSKASFEADFISVCKLHGVRPAEAVQSISRMLAAEREAKQQGR